MRIVELLVGIRYPLGVQRQLILQSINLSLYLLLLAVQSLRHVLHVQCLVYLLLDEVEPWRPGLHFADQIFCGVSLLWQSGDFSELCIICLLRLKSRITSV